MQDSQSGAEVAPPQPDAQQAGAPVDRKRRGLLRAVFGTAVGWGAAAFGLAGGLWAAATARFLMPNAAVQPRRRFKVGFPSDYAADSVATKYSQRYGVWIVRGLYRGQAQFYALRTTCTHLGCITLWQSDERRFRCPCHGSAFLADGINCEGPAARPLERYALRIAEDGQLEVDKGKTYRQELGQWSDPASFVPA